MGLLQRIKERARQDIKIGKDLVNTSKRVVNNQVDNFRVGLQIAPQRRQLFNQQQAQRDMRVRQNNQLIMSNIGNTFRNIGNNLSAGDQRINELTSKSKPLRALNYARKALVSTNPVETMKNMGTDATKTLLSLKELPQVYMTGKPTNKDYNTPIGRMPSQITDFGRDVNAVIEGKRPMSQLIAAPFSAVSGVTDISGAANAAKSAIKSLPKSSSKKGILGLERGIKDAHDDFANLLYRTGNKKSFKNHIIENYGDKIAKGQIRKFVDDIWNNSRDTGYVANKLRSLTENPITGVKVNQYWKEGKVNFGAPLNDPLSNEARSKYFAKNRNIRSKEDFLKEHIVYHGGDKNFIDKQLIGKKSFKPDAKREAGTGGNMYGLSTSTDYRMAKDFSTSSTYNPKVAELYIDPRAKTYNLKGKAIDDLSEKEIREIAKNYDVIRDFDNIGGESEVRVLNDSILRDRDQIESFYDLIDSGLINDYNQSTGKKKGFVNFNEPLSTTPKTDLNDFDSFKFNEKKPEITQQDADNMVNGAIYRATEHRKGFLQIFDKWIADKEIAKTTGAETSLKYNVPSKESKSAISELENGLKGNKYAGNIRKAYDDLFKSAEKLGKDTKQEIAYRQNYLTHVWANTPREIEQAFLKVGKKFSFANSREIPTYEEGIKMGLTPKYSNPAQMVGEYAKKISETKTNLDFFNNLKDSGYIVPGSIGRNAGFVPINAQGFPQSTTSFNGQTFTGQWYAPKEIANEINKVFNPQDSGTIGKVAKIGAKISGGAQDILLSGGIPKTPVNAFTIAQMTKELLAGRVKSPFTSLVRSLDSGTTKNFFSKNVGAIKEMQSMNIPIRTEFDIANVADRGWVQNTFGKGFGEIWDKTVNTPTFKRFMPMLQVNLYNDIKNGAIKAGRTPEEAVNIAGKAVRNFYGLGNTGKAARASQLGKDVVSAGLFAPRYRESMVNFWINNIKSLATTDRNKLMANKTNLTFLVGATATLIAMDKLNTAINGHGMGENPDGKTDKLLIPIGGGKTLGIPFLSSIATVPRSIYATGKDLYKGDFKAASRDVKSNVSMAFKPLMDVANNENYFGSEIYNENSTAGEKLKASANYLLNPVTGAYTHPYIREGAKFAQGKQGLTETLSKATELPIRWYSTKSIQDAPFWKEYENQKKVSDIMDSAKYGKISQEDADKQIQKLTGGKSVPNGTIVDNGKGYVSYKTSKGIQFADSLEEAQKAINKDDFDKSGKKSDLINGTYYYRDKNGKPLDMSEDEFNMKLATAKLEQAYDSDNYKEYVKIANEKLALIEKQYDGADPLTQIELQNDYNDLQNKLEKYKGYGGSFKKPKKGKKYNLAKVAAVKISTPARSYKATIRSQRPKTVKFKSPKVKTYKLKVTKAPKLAKLKVG